MQLFPNARAATPALRPRAGALLRLAFAIAVLIPFKNAPAQISPPNAAGVTMGHLHYVVSDIAANRDFWLRLGGETVPAEGGQAIRLPGLLIHLSEGQAGDAPSVIDHVAFRVASLDAVADRGFELEMIEAFPGIASVYTPSGDRIELFEEGTATNVWFAPDRPDETAERHNQPIAGPIDSHHLHFYLPEDAVSTARDWYVEHFGATPGMRWRYPAADLPGMNLNFSVTTDERSGSRGTSLDHIGFEVENLEAFVRQLAARGIEFDEPYRQVSAGASRARLTDPWGTTIELTQGLVE